MPSRALEKSKKLVGSVYHHQQPLTTGINYCDISPATTGNYRRKTPLVTVYHRISQKAKKVENLHAHRIDSRSSAVLTIMCALRLTPLLCRPLNQFIEYTVRTIRYNSFHHTPFHSCSITCFATIKANYGSKDIRPCMRKK